MVGWLRSVFEIFYDHGDHIWGGPPGSPEEDGDRFVEIWNLVFMQFTPEADDRRRPAQAENIDTGMGIERIAAVMQGVQQYDTDTFRNLIAASRADRSEAEGTASHVIADHLRSTSFLMADGVLPSNEVAAMSCGASCVAPRRTPPRRK